jgi:glycosyltransferase involved in cell wall biosynthesis
MKILLDNIIYSKERQGGISNVFSELTTFLQKFPEIDLKFIEEINADLNGCRQKIDIEIQQIINHKTIKPLFLSRLLPISIDLKEPFLYHSSYFRAIKGPKNYSEVTTIYDFVHDYYESFLKKTIHNNLKFGAVKRSNGIICISENTYKDLKKFCPPKKHQKVEIIHCGVSEDYFPILDESNIKSNHKIYNLENGFLLYIGSRASYKNFNFTVKLLSELTEFKLVVVGQPFTEKEKQLIGPNLLSRITLISGVDNQTLNILYNKAYALLYPSSYEGFGIPVIEAMKAGCPVIALNSSSIPEVAGDAGILLEKTEIRPFIDKIDLLKNKDFRSDLIGKGLKQAKNFSWDKCNRETLAFYKEIYNGNLA